MTVELKRVYDDDLSAHEANAVLVDRLWPRGVSKEDAPWGEWCKDVAPSTELREWYDHVVDRFDEFKKRYEAELAEPPASQAFGELLKMAKSAKGLVLLTATKDVEHSAAFVLKGLIEKRL